VPFILSLLAPSLLTTCREIRREAHPIFFAAQIFSLATSFDVSLLGSKLRSSPETASHLRKSAFTDIRNARPYEDDEELASLIRFCTGLREIDVRVAVDGKWMREMFWTGGGAAAFARMSNLRYLCGFEGVERVRCVVVYEEDNWPWRERPRVRTYLSDLLRAEFLGFGNVVEVVEEWKTEDELETNESV
jgi:hypothetical protein